MQIQQAHISIPLMHGHDVIHDIRTYAQGAMHLHITIAAHAQVVLHDKGTLSLESLELTIEQGAQVFLISQCPHKQISASCFKNSYFSCVQVLNGFVDCQVAQHFLVSMNEAGSKACVRVLPLLYDNQFECYTEQNHVSSNTVSDMQIIGSIHGAGNFGNKSKIIVSPGLEGVHITQKSLMFLVHAQARAYACPCFDVKSKNICCTHGAAIGSLDENQLWYLKARGINHKDSLLLLPRAQCIASIDPAMPSSARKLVCELIES